MIDNDLVLIAIGILMFVHLLLGLPLFMVFGLGSLAMILATGSYSPAIFGEVPFTSMDNWALLALPLFILAGDIIGTGRVASQLVRLGEAFVGWITGGLGMATICGCFLISGTSGSNSSDTAAIGRIMIPSMVAKGYSKSYAAALAASGGCLGIIVPPSLLFIIYGVVTSTSVGDLFIGGILPGVLMTISMCVANYLVCRYSTWGAADRHGFSFRAVGTALWDARYGLGAPAVILGGIYSGVFTPTEASAIAVAYCLLVEILLTKGLQLRDIPRLLERSGCITGLIAPIIGFCLLFGEVLSVLRVPERFASFLLALPSGYVTGVLMMLFILLIVGCFLDAVAAVLILMPILLPVGHALGFHPVHLGVFVMCALTIGFMHPPVGVNLLAASAVSGVPVLSIAWRAWPMFFALIAATLAVAFVPWFSIWFK